VEIKVPIALSLSVWLTNPNVVAPTVPAVTLFFPDLCGTLGPSEIAAEAGVHPGYLAREFRKHYGSTVGAYLRRMRIEYACRELMDSSVAVANIATAAGFADQSHF
jgi:AraC-like DNA-binding protein